MLFRAVSNLPIFRRLFIAFTLTTVIPGIVIALLGTFYLNTLESRGQAVRTSFDAQSLASAQQINLQRMNASLETRFAQIYAAKGGAFTDDNGAPDPALAASGSLIANDIQARELDFDQSLQTYQKNFAIATSANMKSIHDILLSDNPDNISIINNQQNALNHVIAEKNWENYKNAQNQVIQLLDRLQKGDQTVTAVQAYQALYTSRTLFLPLKNNWQLVADSAITIGTAVTQVGPSQTQPILTFTAIAFLFTILVIISTGYIVNVTITQPLRHLALLTRRISKGDTSARAVIRGRDEICLVAASMNNMLDNIVRLIQESQSRHAVLQAQIEKLVSEVSGVGEGDLRIQAEVTTDDLGVLADSFNYMVEELSSLVVRVKSLAKEVETSTTQTYDRMGQLVESADTQIGQISRAATEIGNTAHSSRQVAERAQTLYSIALEAQSTAQNGRGAVRQAVEGMGRIFENIQSTSTKVQSLGDRSREINNIVEVISSIAHQTNRLALDAAIQAAMAGDNGKGFGAVAADIRRLAERSKEQTSIITRIVRNVIEDIGAASLAMNETERETSQGTLLAQEAGRALEAIFPVVERQASEIEIINQMANQQSQSSRSVAQIMQSVTESTQQSSLSTRTASEQMEHMARLAEQLLASVEAFKLRDDQSDTLAQSLNLAAPTNLDQEGNMSFSGVFRTITSSIQPANSDAVALEAPRLNSGSAYYPPAPYQNGNPPYQNGNQGMPFENGNWNNGYQNGGNQPRR
jgi:methyl-accepting chemotaxis protein